MRRGILHADLSLLRQAITVGTEFGVGSLEELARVGLALEDGIYRDRTMRATASGVNFRLTNPPLRLGAFRTVRVWWDGRPMEPARVRVATGRRPDPRPASTVTGADPLELEVGEPSEFWLDLPPTELPGRHRVRIEWESVAIPPLVWLEFVDEPRARE